MLVYCAEFGGTPCELHVESRPMTNGAPVYVATAFVSEDDEFHLRPIHNAGEPRALEVLGSSENDARGRLVTYLERKLGPFAAPPAPCSERLSSQVIKERYDLPA